MRKRAAALALVVMATGCARFDDRLADPFTPVPQIAGGAGQPQSPQAPPPPASSPSASPAPRAAGPCVDPDPNVIATCLDAPSAVVSVGDRTLAIDSGGRAVLAAENSEPEDFGRVETGGGRVVAVTPSPDFSQDGIVYALVAGGGGGRVERLAKGDTSRTVARVGSGSGGGITFVGDVLTVATGSELVRFPGYRGIGDAGSGEVVARDLGDARGLCASKGTAYVTTVGDRGASVRSGSTTVWTWPDQQTIGGCEAAEEALAVAVPGGERVDVLPLADGGIRGKPEPLAEHRYGRLTGVAATADGRLVGSTTNKDGGTPGRTDDRVVLLPKPTGGGGDSRT